MQKIKGIDGDKFVVSTTKMCEKYSRCCECLKHHSTNGIVIENYGMLL